jgi:glycosyltransferase involved in cell wall biosynthesis/Na+/melibiose symporter-like transporter
MTADVPPHPDLPAPEDLPLRPLRHHLALTVYWLSNALMWGALLHLALQSRLNDWFGQDRVGYFLGVLGAVGGLMATVSQIIFGAFSDRSLHPWGRRRPFVLVGSFLTMLALLAMGSARSFWPFAGSLVLLQLCANMASGPFSALLPDTVNPREHGKASGFMGVARLLGDTGGLILAAALLNAGAIELQGKAATVAFHDHRMLLLCATMGGFLLLTAFITCATIGETRLRHRPEATPWETIRGSFAVDVHANRDFFWLSLSRAVTNLGFYMFLEVLFYFIKYSLGRPDPVQGNPNAEHTSMLVMLPAVVMAAAASAPAGLLSDRIGRKRLIYVAQFLLAAAALTFTFAPNLTVVIAAGLPAGVAYGIFTAVEWALACNLLPAGEAARYLGVWNASAAVPQILAFPIAGGVGSAISAAVPGLGWRVDFALSAACCLVGAYFLVHVRERRRAPRVSHPIRVAFVDHAHQLGGAQKSLCELLARLDRKRFTPILLCSGDAQWLSRPELAGVEIVGVFRPMPLLSRRRDQLSHSVAGSITHLCGGFSPALEVRRAIRRLNIDLVHTNTLKAHLLGGLGAHLAGKPLVWHVRDILEPGPARTWLLRAARFLRPQVVAISQAVAEQFAGGVAPVALIYNGIPLDRFTPGPPPVGLREDLRLSADHEVICVVGRLAPWKGHRTLLEALSALRRSRPRAVLVVVGEVAFWDSSYELELKELTRDLGLEEAVRWVGFREDVPDLLRLCDVFVLPSVDEPFGRAIIEAMAVGKPVIATRSGGAPEVVLDGETGLLVEPGNVTELAVAMERLLADRELAARMASAGMARARECFDVRRVVAMVEALHEQLLTQRPEDNQPGPPTV